MALRLFSFWKARPTGKQGIYIIWAGGGLGREAGLEEDWKDMDPKAHCVNSFCVIWDRSFHCSETTRGAHSANDMGLCVVLLEHASSVPLCNLRSTQFREQTGTELAESGSSLCMGSSTDSFAFWTLFLVSIKQEYYSPAPRLLWRLNDATLVNVFSQRQAHCKHCIPLNE